MTDLYYIRIIVLLAITLAYALFDLFNKREVPNIFAYASLLVAIALGITYWNAEFIEGLAISLFISASGYVLYKKGLLGAGDVFELITITLLLPLQPIPILSSTLQLGMPFILSVFISSGYFSIIIIVLYYLLIAKRNSLEKNFKIERKRIFSATAMVLLYLFMVLLIYFTVGIGIPGVLLLLLLVVPSCIMLVYERLINYRMVSMLYPRELTPDDMIATNLMATSDLSYFRKTYQGFGRLATGKLIKKLRTERRKLPVYRNAAPLAAFFFVGVVFSLLFGNLLLFIF